MIGTASGRSRRAFPRCAIVVAMKLLFPSECAGGRRGELIALRRHHRRGDPGLRAGALAGSRRLPARAPVVRIAPSRLGSRPRARRVCDRPHRGDPAVGLADSPLRDRVIFSFGVPRSGTYWLQRILVAHPEVAEVPSETSLFYTGLRPLLGLFHHGARGSQAPGIFVERAELLDAARDFCDRFLATSGSLARDTSQSEPRCTSTALTTSLALYPDARLLHIIRDGRDVARSLLGREWGPSSVAEAAEQWRSGVARRARRGRMSQLPGGPLRGAARRARTGKIADLYGWLGLPAEAGTMAAAMAEAGRERNEDPSDPRIAAGKWRDEWGEDDVAAFMEVAGDLLVELGYDAEIAPRQAPGAGGDGRRRGDRLATLRSTVARRRRERRSAAGRGPRRRAARRRRGARGRARRGPGRADRALQARRPRPHRHRRPTSSGSTEWTRWSTGFTTTRWLRAPASSRPVSRGPLLLGGPLLRASGRTDRGPGPRARDPRRGCGEVHALPIPAPFRGRDGLAVA